jgi:mediator of RNA polymerase II transcription subunit 5
MAADMMPAVARKEFAEGLERFIPSIMQTSSDLAARLEHFRTQTIANFEPAGKKDTSADIPSYMDMMGLENFQIPAIPTVNSRAGLYLYLSAAVRLSPQHVARPWYSETWLMRT